MSTRDLDSRIERFENRVVGRSISEDTFDQYARWVRRFEAWMGEYSVTDPGIATLEDFDSFLADESRTEYPWENGRGLPAPPAYGYRTRIVAASGVKKWVRRDYGTDIPETPSDICIGQPEPFDPTYIDPDEIEQTIASAHDCNVEGCEAALRLSYDAILRASELVRVRRDDVDLTEGTVYVRATKGSQNAGIGISQETQDALRRHIQNHPERSGKLFLNSYGNGWSANAWSNHVRRNHHEDGSHAFGRHSPIMHRLEGGQPFGDVFRRARHSNPSMTTRYARQVGVDVPDWVED
jgi:integrase